MGKAEIAIPDQYLASSRAVYPATARCYQHGAAGPWQVVTLTAGSRPKRRSYQGYAKDNRTAFNCRRRYRVVVEDRSVAPV